MREAPPSRDLRAAQGPPLLVACREDDLAIGHLHRHARAEHWVNRAGKRGCSHGAPAPQGPPPCRPGLLLTSPAPRSPAGGGPVMGESGCAMSTHAPVAASEVCCQVTRQRGRAASLSARAGPARPGAACAARAQATPAPASQTFTASGALELYRAPVAAAPRGRSRRARARPCAGPGRGAGLQASGR